MPADIERCIREKALAALPDRDITKAELETLLKDDGLVFREVKGCGLRAVEWFKALRARWR